MNLIEETGHFNVTNTTFDFDLFSLDETTVRKLQTYLAATATWHGLPTQNLSTSQWGVTHWSCRPSVMESTARELTNGTRPRLWTLAVSKTCGDQVLKPSLHGIRKVIVKRLPFLAIYQFPKHNHCTGPEAAWMEDFLFLGMFTDASDQKNTEMFLRLIRWDICFSLVNLGEKFYPKTIEVMYIFGKGHMSYISDVNRRILCFLIKGQTHFYCGNKTPWNAL